MRYKSHFTSSRRFSYAQRTYVGGGHNVYIVDYILNKDSLYCINAVYDSTTGNFIITYDFDSYTPFYVDAKNDSATGIYRIDNIKDFGALYNTKEVGDYNR